MFEQWRARRLNQGISCLLDGMPFSYVSVLLTTKGHFGSPYFRSPHHRHWVTRAGAVCYPVDLLIFDQVALWVLCQSWSTLRKSSTIGHPAREFVADRRNRIDLLRLFSVEYMLHMYNLQPSGISKGLRQHTTATAFFVVMHTLHTTLVSHVLQCKLSPPKKRLQSRQQSWHVGLCCVGNTQSKLSRWRNASRKYNVRSDQPPVWRSLPPQ